MKRRPMKKSNSKQLFKRSSAPHPKNITSPSRILMRGGQRL